MSILKPVKKSPEDYIHQAITELRKMAREHELIGELTALNTPNPQHRGPFTGLTYAELREFHQHNIKSMRAAAEELVLQYGEPSGVKGEVRG